jgi:outer membrane protein assembly factor BamB
VLIPLLVLAVIAAGCAKVAGPRGWAQPELTDNVLYVTLDKGKLSAIDAGTYQTIWTFPANETFACGNGESKKWTIDGIYGTPAVDDSLVYFASYDGAVWAVKRSDGTCVWRIETGDAILAAPLLGPSGLYVAATDGYIYALDPATGDQKNRFNSGEVWTTPLLTDDALYVATMAGQLWKLDPKTLDTVWSAPFKADAGLLTPPTLVGDNTIVVGGIGGDLYAVDTTSGQQKWTATGSNWFWGQPAVFGTTVIVTDLAGEVKALDAATGQSVWAADFITQNPIRTGAVLASKETLVVVDNSGQVYRIDPAAGTSIGQPVLLNEGVLATPLVVVTGGVTATPAGSPIQPSGTGNATPGPSTSTVFIVTQSGHLFTLDPVSGRTVQVVGS